MDLKLSPTLSRARPVQVWSLTKMLNSGGLVQGGGWHNWELNWKDCSGREQKNKITQLEIFNKNTFYWVKGFALYLRVSEEKYFEDNIISIFTFIIGTGGRWSDQTADHYVNVSIEIVLSWMLFTEDESLSNYWQWTVQTEQLALSDTNRLLPTNWYYNNSNQPLVQHQTCRDIWSLSLSLSTWKHKKSHPLIGPFYFPWWIITTNNLSLIKRFTHT